MVEVVGRPILVVVVVVVGVVGPLENSRSPTCSGVSAQWTGWMNVLAREARRVRGCDSATVPVTAWDFVDAGMTEDSLLSVSFAVVAMISRSVFGRRRCHNLETLMLGVR